MSHITHNGWLSSSARLPQDRRVAFFVYLFNRNSTRVSIGFVWVRNARVERENEGASKDGNKCRVTARRFVRISVRAKQITQAPPNEAATPSIARGNPESSLGGLSTDSREKETPISCDWPIRDTFTDRDCLQLSDQCLPNRIVSKSFFVEYPENNIS